MLTARLGDRRAGKTRAELAQKPGFFTCTS